MITTKPTDAILPLDLSSIAQLLHAPEGEFTPLAYDILNTQQIMLRLALILHSVTPIHSNPPQRTNCKLRPLQSSIYEQSMIPWSNTIVFNHSIKSRDQLAQLRSQINDDVLSIHIPFQ